MNKLKKFMSIVLALAIMLSFAACGQKDGWDDDEEEWGSHHDRDEDSDDDQESTDKNTSSNKDHDKNTQKVPDEDTEKADTAATINGQNLDSVQANYYLTDHIHNAYSQLQVSFGSDINSYLSLMGLDATKPLNEQFYDLQAGITWADHYLEKALDQAKSDYALYNAATTAGFQLTQEQLIQIDAEVRDLVNQYANLYGYANADKYLEARYGKGSSLNSYCEYAKISTIASAYYVNYMQSLTYDQTTIRAYEKTNESYYATFNTNPLANVRHLLIVFENGTDAKAEAERILQIWKDGSRTEESFIELVKQYTDDDASKETGGLYEDIHPQSSYVPNFLNWAIDPSHKPGDAGIVETEYGYHIMYFVGYSNLTYRDYMIREDMRIKDITDWYNAIISSTTATVVSTENLNMNIVMANS